MNQAEIAQTLRAARQNRRLSQREFADIVGIGRNQVARFELGHHDLALNTVEAMANALGYELILRRK